MMKYRFLLSFLFLTACFFKTWSSPLSLKELTNGIFLEKMDNQDCYFSFGNENNKKQNIRLSIYNIKNKSKDTVLVLFEKDSILSNNEILNNRFFRKAPHSQEFLFRMAMEFDAQWEHSIFETVFKRLLPSHSFEIIMINCSPESEEKILNSVRIIPISEFKTEHKFRLYRLLEIPDDSPLWYRPDIIIFDAKSATSTLED